MKSELRVKVENAKNENELHLIIESIPLQENGMQQKIARILDDTFWYFDLDSFEKKKKFMLSRLTDES